MFCKRPWPGLFCVIEGIDGSGKSTLTEKVASELRKQSRPVAQLVEPTDLPSGKAIRNALKSAEPLSDAHFLEMFFEDRKNNLKQRVCPALLQGKTVIQDRYFYSTAAYQSKTTTEARTVLEQSLKLFPEPDVLCFIDVTLELALSRITQRNEIREVFEKESELSRIQNNYHSILPQKTLRLDGSKTIEQLVLEILEHIAESK